MRISQLLGTIATGLSLSPFGAAHAEDSRGIYVGSSLGQSEVNVSAPFVGDVSGPSTGYKVFVEARPISRFGVEVAYLDYGHPDTRLGSAGFPADASAHGFAAQGVLHLHGPVPSAEVFLKAGIAQASSTLHGIKILPGPGAVFPIEQKLTSTGLAAGGGVQYAFGRFAVRAEYEYVDVARGALSLISLGVIWKLAGPR